MEATACRTKRVTSANILLAFILENSSPRYRRLALQPKARVIGFLLSPLGGIIADDGSAHSVTRGIEMGDATDFVNMVRGEFGR